MRKILIILAVITFTAVVPVCAADNVGGTWVLTMMNPQGEADNFDMVITQDGKKLNVTITNSELQAMLSGAGTLKGSKIKFNLKGPDNQFEFIFEGKVTGKKMEGTREIQDDRGGNVTFLPPSNDGKKPTVDEIENIKLNTNTWSAVMK